MVQSELDALRRAKERDKFAKAALTGFLAHAAGGGDVKLAVALSYEVAQLMLEERKKYANR